MKNLNDYKRRFNILMESEMGDVRPLISEAVVSQQQITQAFQEMASEGFKPQDVEVKDNAVTLKIKNENVCSIIENPGNFATRWVEKNQDKIQKIIDNVNSIKTPQDVVNALINYSKTLVDKIKGSNKSQLKQIKKDLKAVKGGELNEAQDFFWGWGAAEIAIGGAMFPAWMLSAVAATVIVLVGWYIIKSIWCAISGSIEINIRCLNISLSLGKCSSY